MLVRSLAVAVLLQLELDCAHPVRARQEVGRTMLSEIEQVEDAAGRALADALLRCRGDEPCRADARARFERDWAARRTEIEARYSQLLREFEARCQGALSGPLPPGRPGAGVTARCRPRTG